jgi:ornithine cyclodeaminase/alanine dehydrogenase-like protein (mu-crystallin family)
MRIYSADQVYQTLPMREAIEAMRRGFIALSTWKATVPVRGVLPVNGNTTLTMPAYIHGSEVSVVKVISVYPGNAERDLPVVLGNVLVLDANTGEVVALIHGGALTALRTGAASGLATDLLAEPDAHVLAVIGAGKQARTQVEAVCAVRPIDRIRVYSPHNAEAFADELHARYGVDVAATADAKSALKEAQVVIAATNSAAPVVRLEDVQPGVHINGVGSFRPEMQEIAADVVQAAKIVVDHRESVWHEAGDLIIPRDQGLISESSVHAELGEIAAGLRPGRTSPEEITFFKSVGNAVQDAAAAERLIQLSG